LSDNDHVSDTDYNPAKKAKGVPVSGSAGKKSAKAPKVGPKKSATAKPIAKPSAKSKKVVDTESESDFEDSMSYSMTKLAAKANEGKKGGGGTTAAKNVPHSVKNKKPEEKTKQPPKQVKTEENTKKLAPKSVPQPKTTSRATPKANKKATPAKSSTKSKQHKAMFSDSEADNHSDTATDDTDTSLIRDLDQLPNKKARTTPSPPTLTPQKAKLKQKQKTGQTGSHSVTKSNLKGGLISKAAAVAAAAKKGPVRGVGAAVPAIAARRRTRGSSISSEGSVKSGGSFGGMSSRSSGDSDASGGRFDRKKKVKDKRKGGTMDKDKLNTKVERPMTRKQTRGTASKRSVHITGRRDSSESESEADDGHGSPSKKGGGGGRGALLKSTVPKPQYPPLENRNCPVPGCDSVGHLSGKLERHFTHDACPLYHNTSDAMCRSNMKEWTKKENSRKKALALLATRSPQSTPSAEQRKYVEKVREERKMIEDPVSQDDEDDTPVTERERKLTGLVSGYDLALFKEAQSSASQVIEEQLKGLPDVKGTKYIEMGRYQMEVWYQSPYPEDYTVLPKLYICEFCLKYMKASSVMKRHAAKCVWKHPPGDEIYRKDKLSVFEVCGKKYKQYCQNLCLIAKSFLDHKTLYYDVEPFLFYVMTVADSEGCHIVGYFSKEKNSFLNYNVSCILTLPPYQRQGYGRLLIDFSYLLSKMEGKIGSPEKPLSDLGLISYRAYWKDILLCYMCNYPEKEISIKSMSEEMGIHSYDIVSTLQYLGMIKYWKGKHVILKKEDVIEDYLERSRRRPRDKEISGSHLKWKPYEPTAKEKRQAEQIKKKQEERQKAR